MLLKTRRSTRKAICLQRGVPGSRGAFRSDCNAHVHSHSREPSTPLTELTESSAASRAPVFCRTQSDRMVPQKPFSTSRGSGMPKEGLLLWQRTSHMQKAVGSKLELRHFWIPLPLYSSVPTSHVRGSPFLSSAQGRHFAVLFCFVFSSIRRGLWM